MSLTGLAICQYILLLGNQSRALGGASGGTMTEQALPGVSEHALGRANQVRTSRLLSSQTNDDGRRVGQRDLARDRRPPGERWALQAEETKQAEDATEEALDTGTCTQLLGGPGRG